MSYIEFYDTLFRSFSGLQQLSTLFLILNYNLLSLHIKSITQHNLMLKRFLEDNMKSALFLTTMLV